MLIAILCCWRRLRPLARIAFTFACMVGLAAVPLMYAVMYWLHVSYYPSR